MKKRKNKSYYLVPGVYDFYSETVGIVELDPEIALIAQCLNYKGYETRASCAGHWTGRPNRGDEWGYIWVAVLPTEKLPSGAYSEPSSAGEGYCIRWQPKSQKQLKTIHTKLENWVHTLKEI